MWNRYFALLVLAALLRTEFELSHQTHTREEPQISYLRLKSPDALRQKQWTEKAIKNYTAAQDKKWRRWREAMFEAKIP